MAAASGIRGAPQRGLARLMARISWRISSETFGLPLRHLDFHRQNKRNPARCQRMTVAGSTIARALTKPHAFAFSITRRWICASLTPISPMRSQHTNQLALPSPQIFSPTADWGNSGGVPVACWRRTKRNFTRVAFPIACKPASTTQHRGREYCAQVYSSTGLPS